MPIKLKLHMVACGLLGSVTAAASYMLGGNDGFMGWLLGVVAIGLTALIAQHDGRYLRRQPTEEKAQ